MTLIYNIFFVIDPMIVYVPSYDHHIIEPRNLLINIYMFRHLFVLGRTHDQWANSVTLQWLGWNGACKCTG